MCFTSCLHMFRYDDIFSLFLNFLYSHRHSKKLTCKVSKRDTEMNQAVLGKSWKKKKIWDNNLANANNISQLAQSAMEICIADLYKRAKTYLVSSVSPDETENTADEEKNQHWYYLYVVSPQAERQSVFQVTINNILGTTVGYPSSISWTRDHFHALQALFLGPSAGWWDEEELVTLSPERHCMDRAVEQEHSCCPQSSPGGCGKAEHWAASDAAPKWCDCSELQEAPFAVLNHLALHLSHPGFSVRSNCSSAGLGTWEKRAKGCGAAVLRQASSRVAFWQWRKPVGSCPNSKMLEAS